MFTSRPLTGSSRLGHLVYDTIRPISTTKKALEILEKHFAPAVARPTGFDMVVDYAKGCWIYDVEGRKYLDATTGIGVTSTGHCHPKVVAAAQAQTAKGIHLQQTIVISQPLVNLIEKIITIAPPELSRVYFNLSGAEAVETALKLARHATGRPNVIVFRGSFHGRSIGTMALTTSKYVYRSGYGPLPSGVHVAHFPYCHHCKFISAKKADSGVLSCTSTLDYSKDCCQYSTESVELILKQETCPSETAMVLIEPIQGEGGYVVPPVGFMKKLREICDKHKILLCADEIQSGAGRTGKWWAFEHEGIVPDILIFAKGIASGFPLSGVMAKDHIFKSSPAVSMGGTYACNAVVAAASLATINVIQEEKLLDNATKRGKQLQDGLKVIAAKYPGYFSDIRGRGLMVGVELNADKCVKDGITGVAGRIQQECLKNGLLIITTGIYETIRFIPPLIISEVEMGDLLQRLDDACKKVFAKK